MEAPRQGQVEWADRERFLVVPVLRSLGRILDMARARGAAWVVLRRAVDQERPHFYVYRTSELETSAAQRPERLGLTAFDALELREAGKSATSTGADRPRRAPLGDATWPSSSRVVHLDPEGRPVAVGQISEMQPVPPAPGPMRGGGRRTRGGPPRTRGTPPAPPPSPSAAPAPTRAAPPPPPPPPDGGAAAPRSSEAVLSAQGPAEVQVGREAEVDVMVALAGTAAPLAHAVTAAISATEQIVAILTIRGDAIEALDPRHLRLDLPTADQPSTSVFLVRAVREGAARIGVIFRQGGTELGTVTFPMKAVATAPKGAPASGVATAAPRNPADDGVLLLVIDEERSAGEQRYRYRLVSTPLRWDFKEFFSAPLKDRGAGVAATPREYVQSIYERLSEATSGSRSGLATQLRALGTDLSRQLFPSDFVRLLWDHREKLQTVHVKSWEPLIPWELVRLRHPDTQARDERFLAEYNLVRSLNGDARPPGLSLRAWRYLVATYPNGLEESLEGDLAVFTEALKARRIAATPIAADPDAIFDALNEPDFDVLHICCHGQAEHDDIERSALIIGDRLGPGGVPEPITIDALTVREEARLASRGPIIFLNACESGRTGASLTAWGGWPQTFWEAGAAAFVGTSWPVEDTAAKAFCETFYGALLDGQTLAEAAGSARRASKERDEATWLAYKVYGYPGARHS